MSTIESRINNRSEEFLANRAWMRGLVEDLELNIERIRQGGGKKYQQRHVDRMQHAGLTLKFHLCVTQCLDGRFVLTGPKVGGGQHLTRLPILVR